MKTSLLAAAVLLASWIPSQEWSWDEVTTDTNGNPLYVPMYRIYQSPFPDCFTPYYQMTEWWAEDICGEPWCDPGRCCATTLEPTTDRQTYYRVVAVKVSGVESPWPETIRKQEQCP